MSNTNLAGQHKSTQAKDGKPVAILGWYGSSNAGDEAVLQSVVGSLRRNDLDNLLVLSTNPERTATAYGVPSLPRNPLSLATLRAVRGSRALILGGGGLIQDSSSVYNLPLYAFFVALARLSGIPVIGWGLGVGPLYTNLGRLLARFIVGSSVHFSVRDRQSARQLERAGVSQDGYRVTADPAFLIEPDEHTTTQPPRESKPVVVFCVRHRLHDEPGLNLRYLLPVSIRHRLGLEVRGGADEDARFVQAIARGVRLCVQEFGARVELLPFWAERDDEVLEQVRQESLRLGVLAEAVSWAQVAHTPSSLAAHLSRVEMLVSMRLHALIFGASAGVPSLALSYVPKVRAQMARMGARRWVVEVQTRVPSPEEVEMKLRLLWAGREVERQRLSRAAARLKSVAEADGTAVAEILRA